MAAASGCALLAIALSPSASAQAPWSAELDHDRLSAALAQAPQEGGPNPSTIELPLIDGAWSRFQCWQAPILAPELAASFPQIRIYQAQGLDDPSLLATVILSPLGTHAMVLRGGEATLVSSLPRQHDIVLVRPTTAAGFDCQLFNDQPSTPVQPYEPRGPGTLRTYRFACACTGEFAVAASEAQGHAPNVPDALAAVAIMTAYTSLLTERDVDVRLQLVANNAQVIFLNPATDPYDAADSNANLSANSSTLTGRIGSSNYDLGHVLTRIPGGVAYLSSACNSQKAGGVSGTARTDTGDPFDPQIMMHEVGHQLGANHSFNGSIDRCLGNRSANTAWEPGSGTTILSYAGGCPVGNVPPGDNVVVSRDIMYHVGNILEMRTRLANGGGSCGGSAPTGNSPPVIQTFPPLTGLSIPANTPFDLAGSATDVEDTALTYSWEEIDLGPQQPLTDPDNGQSPLFRCFPPRSTGARVFPQLADLRSGVPTPGEKMPAAASSGRKFRLGIRDNHVAGGGVTISSTVTLPVVAGTGFRVTYPGAGDLLAAGAAGVTWNVASTNIPPISTSTVDVWLSTDDGLSFPTVLAANVPNTGGATVTIPRLSTSTARLRINAVGNVYFAFSSAFSIQPCNPDVNSDGNIDQGDVDSLITIIAGGPNPTGFDADFNIDGVADQGDVSALIDVVAGGFCP